ncbi:MAG: DUF370 domain-containing protein [Oscillospiraceae bacterium]|jgi:regulator of extracellular matrix RemA (YlzA/DUF370 family)|nr:DUF370 domain-containing protein [Oscillospiraceae bacterium]
MIQLVNIGFGNMLSAGRILAVLHPDSQPVKRLAQEAKAAGTIIDATHGRRTRAVLVLDSGHTVLSYLQPETVANRLKADAAALAAEDEDESSI